MRTITGLERLVNDNSLQSQLKGNIGLLCHAAAVTPDYTFSAIHFKRLFGNRLTKLFGPQHGMVTDVQDNMIETEDYIHPYFNVPVFSLYGKVRWPTEHMLKDMDTFVIDLQDIGTRVYTYIWTLSYILEKAHKTDLNVVVLDRPNPLGGEILEGTILEKEFASFVGRDELLHRHGLTIGEFGEWFIKHNNLDVNYKVIPCANLLRSMMWNETGLPWLPASPNIPVPEGAYCFPATVMLEGTMLSEGRGTTRPLEVFGHPKFDPFKFMDNLHINLNQDNYTLRPFYFHPMFQKHAEKTCGGIQIHPTNLKEFRPWMVGMLLLREFSRTLGSDFQWRDFAYEYEDDKLAIDLINGNTYLREWVDNKGELDVLLKIEAEQVEKFRNSSQSCHIYH
jgi:uncharacterized protein YbbC (DUF1343 family)